MKKILFLTLSALCLTFTSCAKSNETPRVIDNKDNSLTITRIDEDEKAIRFNKKFDGFNDVTIIDTAASTKKNSVAVNLSDYSDKQVLLELKCDIRIDDPKNSNSELIWIINEIASNFPQLYRGRIQSGKWITISENLFVELGKNRSLYISPVGLPKDAKIYIKNFSLKISGDEIGQNAMEVKTWTEAGSIKEKYKGIFDYFGIAVTYKEELSKPEVQKGLAYQADCITMGNEFKPDFIFNWQQPQTFTEFTGKDGRAYKVPSVPPKFTTVDKCLQICKDNGLKMRGHVLVWHSQTPDWFFYENWGLNNNKTLVSKNEMAARQEWYIKTVLEHVADWEKKNNNGEHIIFAWDVVNEAASDGANASHYLRGADTSKWYAVYEDVSFIVDAFTFANKYAPKDVKLCYNDYNTYADNKLNAICKIIDAIQAEPKARIDAVGMQSHMKIDYPGTKAFEKAVNTLTAKGLNVQITEIDIANGKATYNSTQLKKVYKDYFELFIKCRKTADKKGIEGVTVWGINDETTWLNAMQEYKGHTQYPLLFKNKNYICKPAFYGVIEAAEEK